VVVLRTWLERHHRWLLLFDNADDPQAMIELLPRSGTGHVLVTSRTETGWDQLTTQVPIDVLIPADAAGFLLARTGDKDLPLRRQRPLWPPPSGACRWRWSRPAPMWPPPAQSPWPGMRSCLAPGRWSCSRGRSRWATNTVATTWSLLLQRLREAEPAAVGLLTLAAFLAPDDLPQPLLTATPTYCRLC
jgi:hypothetical protein